MFAHLFFKGLWLPELTDLMNSLRCQGSKLPDGVVLAVWGSDYVGPVQQLMICNTTTLVMHQKSVPMNKVAKTVVEKVANYFLKQPTIYDLNYFKLC